METQEHYEFDELPAEDSFRILELYPGQVNDPVVCQLHVVNWDKAPEYEAVSYAWGDPTAKHAISCHGRRFNVTQNLHEALSHLRYRDRPRMVWVDAVCVNQAELTELGHQVKQMRRIYQASKTVLVWLGPDSESRQAQAAMNCITTIADFLLQKLDISATQLRSIDNSIYADVVFKNRSRLPVPGDCVLSSETLWNTLLWFYSHAWFTRVWAIQEVNANKERLVYCGQVTIDWYLTELVAGYIIMESAFCKTQGFSAVYCWFAANMARKIFRQPDDWVSMLYLSSRFFSTDLRDMVYGLRGLMNITHTPMLMEPDYRKSKIAVYRDSVEAALLDFRNSNVLLYVASHEEPSWVPRWDEPMRFRNPFRLEKALPWRPAGDSELKWQLDEKANLLHISGRIIDSIKQSEAYSEMYFGNAMLQSEETQDTLCQKWRVILANTGAEVGMPLSRDTLTAMATSFSFGLDENTDPADGATLRRNFVQYLRLVLDEKVFNQYVPSAVQEESQGGNGSLFGKPVWDNKYPDSGFFITNEGLFGCAISPTRPGDVVSIVSGCAFPIVLRPQGGNFRIVGYAFVHGIMQGEKGSGEFRMIELC